MALPGIRVHTAADTPGALRVRGVRIGRAGPAASSPSLPIDSSGAR